MISPTPRIIQSEMIQSNILIIFCGVAMNIFSFAVRSRPNECTCMEHWTCHVIHIRSLSLPLSLSVCVCVYWCDVYKNSAIGEIVNICGRIFHPVNDMHKYTVHTYTHNIRLLEKKMRASWTLDSNPILEKKREKNSICNASIWNFMSEMGKKLFESFST